MTQKETIDQETLHLILPSKIARVVDLLSAETGEDAVSLMQKFYASNTYASLREESSKFWWFSPAELCELYHRETDSKSNPTTRK